MAQVIWTEAALIQLDDIAEYIALDKPGAAKNLVHSVFNKVDRLERFPKSGRTPPEFSSSVYREVIVPSCRIFYRINEGTVVILYVMRQEREMRIFMLENE